MSVTCDAKIRPFRPVGKETEIECEAVDAHDLHVGILRDYAYEGSRSEVTWLFGDRRSFNGEWPGECDEEGCFLPKGHKGNHA